MNRADKRADKAAQRADGSKPWPGIHGTNEQCGNCYFSYDRAAHAKIIARVNAIKLRAGQPAAQPMPEDETYCLFNTTDVAKKIWGWCSHWSQDVRQRGNGVVE